MNHYGLPIDVESLRQVYLDSFRNILAPENSNISDEALAASLRQTFEQLNPEEQNAFAVLSLRTSYESFFSDLGNTLGNIGQALPSIARAVAPIAQIAAPVVGTLIGGPAGTALGTAVSGLIGTLASQGSPGQAAPSPAPPRAAVPRVAVPRAAVAPPRPQPAPTPPPAATPTPAAAEPSSPATAQLMTLLTNPQLIQALLGQLMGTMGNSSASVQRGSQTEAIPFASLMNTLGEYALRAAEESVRNDGFESADYLTDHRGQSLVNNPADPAERADAVYKLLSEQSNAVRQVSSPVRNSNPQADPVTQWLLSAGMVR